MAVAALYANEVRAANEPTTVDVGLRLIDVAKIHNQSETFTVEAILYLDFKVDPSMVTTVGEWTETAVDEQLKRINWWLAPEFENGLGTRQRSGMILSIDKNGAVAYEERFTQVFKSELFLAKFPFDSQILPIKVIIGGNPQEDVILRISEFSRGPVRLPEWKFHDQSFAASVRKDVRPYGANNSPLFNQALFEIKIERLWGFYFWRIILPLLIITTVSWAVFWIKENELGSRLGISFTALLTIVAFNLIVADALPKIGYLTLADALITLTYVWLALAIIQSVIVCRLHLAGTTSSASKIDVVSRWIFPVSYLTGITALFLIFLH